MDESDDNRSPTPADERGEDRSLTNPDEPDDFYRGGGATVSTAQTPPSSPFRNTGGLLRWVERSPRWVPGLIIGYSLSFAAIVTWSVGMTPTSIPLDGAATVFLACFLFILTLGVFQIGWSLGIRGSEIS